MTTPQGVAHSIRVDAGGGGGGALTGEREAAWGATRWWQRLCMVKVGGKATWWGVGPGCRVHGRDGRWWFCGVGRQLPGIVVGWVGARGGGGLLERRRGGGDNA